MKVNSIQLIFKFNKSRKSLGGFNVIFKPPKILSRQMPKNCL